MQLLKGSDISIKNGTIKFEDNQLKMGIQNYSNLTLNNVTLIGGPTIQYVLSNNYGNVMLQNNTTLIPSEGRVAFDAWYGMFDVYDEPGVFVTLDNTVEVNGKVEFGKQARASWSNFASNASITVPADYDLAITPSSAITDGTLEWIDNGDGTKSYRYVPADDN